MLAHPPATPRDLLTIVDFSRLPELQRRGRFRTGLAASQSARRKRTDVPNVSAIGTRETKIKF
jgi:hypothetical protein